MITEQRLLIKGDYVKTVQTLIDLARAKVHTDRELADAIGELPQNLNAMRKGRRAVSPETVAALCDVLQLSGEEAREWLAVSVIDNPKNAGRIEMLRKALFACWVLGVGIPLALPNDATASGAAGSTTERSYRSVTYSLYIVAHLARFARLLATVRTMLFCRTRPDVTSPQRMELAT